jgi:hypothetical protein
MLNQMDNLMNKLNMFIMEIGEHKLILVSKEIDKGIPATNFFYLKLL